MSRGVGKMSAVVSSSLSKTERTLPSHYYFDPDHYQRELNLFWFRDWHVVGRVDGLANPGDFRLVEIGDQNIVVTRNTQGDLKAFHNTCRHRGSILCTQATGHFSGARIVCPYHAWTYSLDGDLTHTPWRLPASDFDASDYSLYQVSVGEWAGFLFLNLEQQPHLVLEEAISSWPGLFSGWDFATSGTGHKQSWTINCNWKVFWENFSECYHCPGIHPELSRLSKHFGTGTISPSDDPTGNPQSDPQSPHPSKLLPGVETWSDDGRSRLPHFAGLSEQERHLGHNFAIFRPSGFIGAHRDYVRFGYLVPLGPEQVRFSVEWLFPPQTLENPKSDLSSPIEFIERLTEQDARVCELNQRGLHARRHAFGVLVAQEYLLSEFHAWVRARLLD